MRKDINTGWLLASAIQGSKPFAFGKIYQSKDDRRHLAGDIKDEIFK
jgi:hypothetical protein